MKDVFFTNELVKERIADLAESDYQNFSSSLIPGCQNMLGCRIPALRNLAKEICKTDFRRYLENASEDYFEETMLQGFVIGYAKMDIEERLCFAKKFIPKIKDWSVNDGFCSTFKAAAQNREQVWKFLLPYAQSGKEFEIRVAAVMYMDYFLTEEYIDRVLKIVSSIKTDYYYINMAISWLLSVAIINYEDKVVSILESKCLSKFVQNKTISKIQDSYRIDKDLKEYVKKLRIR